MAMDGENRNILRYIADLERDLIMKVFNQFVLEQKPVELAVFRRSALDVQVTSWKDVKNVPQP